MSRSVSSVLAAALVALVAFVAAPQPAEAQSAQQQSTAMSFPINTSGAQGVFSGTLRITSFAVQNNALVANGIVTGTLVNATGGLASVARSVTVPVMTGGTARTAAAKAAPGSCEILHLELGPLDLDLLGLVVHLDKIVLDLSAA